jgi:hypothetical protein
MMNSSDVRLFLGFALALGVSSSSCGSGGRNDACGMVQPCAGDPTGIWNITTVCADTSLFASIFKDLPCPTATASLANVTTTGIASFNADKTYSLSEIASGSLNVVFPSSCLVMNGIRRTCLQLIDELANRVDSNGNGFFSSISCMGANGCGTCSAALTPQSMVSDSGTWSTSGTNITLMSATNSNSSLPYCVQGNAIHVGNLVATKQ